MKKIFLFIVIMLFMLSFSPVVRAESSTEDLSFLQMILEQAKILQQKIMDRETSLAVYKMTVIYPNGDPIITATSTSGTASTTVSITGTTTPSIKAGQYTDIKWDTMLSGVSKINIYLTTAADEGNKKEPGFVIARDVPVESSFYHWLVPVNLTGEGYKIFIRNNGKTYRLGDYSDHTFNISKPEAGVVTVKLNSPVGKEMYISGRTYSIDWTMPKTSDRYVSLKLLLASSTATSTNYIPAGLDEYIIASDGSFEWLIPEYVPSGDYKMKVIGLSNLSCNVSESSNIFVSGAFKIVKNVDMPNKIVLLSPPPVAEILSGKPQVISWMSPYDMQRVDILLRGLPSGTIYPIKYGVESGRPVDDNKTDWIPKIVAGKDTMFTVKVCTSSTASCGESKVPFSIVSEKTVTTATSTPVIEPDTPEYNKLREIVGEVGMIISKENKIPLAKVMGTDTPPVVATSTNYASPKQSGYLPYNFDTRLSVGMIDSDAVRALQEALIKEGLFDHPITGRFFDITEAAVKAFQVKYGFDPSGSTGPGTQRKLNELYSVITISSTTTDEL